MAIVSSKNNGFQLTHGTLCEMMQSPNLEIIRIHGIKGLIGYRMSKLPKCETTGIIKVQATAVQEVERAQELCPTQCACVNHLDHKGGLY